MLEHGHAGGAGVRPVARGPVPVPDDVAVGVVEAEEGDGAQGVQAAVREAGGLHAREEGN